VLFLSTYTNKIDKKGRVSIPASFRAALAGENFSGVVAYASFVNPCIEACGISRMESLFQTIDALDPFSEERDAFAATVLGGSIQLAFDGDGRVVLPQILIEKAELVDEAIFIGKGNTFEIWNSAKFSVHSENARKVAANARHMLRSTAVAEEKKLSAKNNETMQKS
jgi:MraZ protein